MTDKTLSAKTIAPAPSHAPVTAQKFKTRSAPPVKPHSKLLNGFRRHQVLFWSVFWVLFALCTVAVWMMPRSYTAQTVLSINLPTIETNADPALKNDLLAREVEILRSDTLIVPISKTFGYSSAFKFLDALDLRYLPGSSLIQIEYTARDPKIAADITNTLGEYYIAGYLTQGLAETAEFTRRTQAHLNQLRAKLLKSEQAVQIHKTQHNLLNSELGASPSQSIAIIEAQLAVAKAEQSEINFRLRHIQNLINTPDHAISSAKLTGSPLIEKLTTEKTELLGTHTELSARYGPKHPKMKMIQTELSALSTAIDQELTHLLGAAENDADAIKSRVEALSTALREIENDTETSNEALNELRVLERQAQSDQLVFETFLKKHQDHNAQNKRAQNTPKAEIVSYAAPPSRSSSPHRSGLLTIGAALSLSLALMITALIARKDHKIDTAKTLEDLIGKPCIASIPYIPIEQFENQDRKYQDENRRRSLGHHILRASGQDLTQTIETIFAALNITLNNKAKIHSFDKNATILTLTSSYKGEGKTTLCAWLGHAAAASGLRTIMIDCHFKNPGLHDFIDHQPDDTLMDYFNDTKDLDSVINRDDESGIHVIYGETISKSTYDLVHSPKFEHMIAYFKERYDLIILDGPPLDEEQNIKTLLQLSDHGLYVLSNKQATRDTILETLDGLSRQHQDLLNFVMMEKD